MSSLFGTVSIAIRALIAEQGALRTTTDNIANVNTPGYTRRRPVMMETHPLSDGNVTFGTGVSLERVESLRDRILELRMHEEAQHRGKQEAFVDAMQPVEGLFSDSDYGIDAQINKLFDSLTRLSTDPSSIPQRQAVLISAGNLASSFRTTARNLAGMRANLSLDITQSVNEINQLTKQIAALNVEVSQQQKLGRDTGSYEDQRTQLIRRLSELADVAIVESDDGLTLTTSSGTALAVGNHSFDLRSALDPRGAQVIFNGENDITAELNGGRLGGLLQVRDLSIPSLLSDLDVLASGLATSLNSAHAQGFDLSSVAGDNLFSVPAIVQGSAATIHVLISDPAKLAASSDGSSGSNGNLANLLAARTDLIADGQNPTDFYGGIVFRLGSNIANSKAEMEAGDIVQRQLESQRSAISGVSMDEEAANLIRFQRAFEAAARVISVIDELTQTAVNLGRN